MKKVFALAAVGIFAFSVSAYAEGGCGGYSTKTAGAPDTVKSILETATQSPVPTTKAGS